MDTTVTREENKESQWDLLSVLHAVNFDNHSCPSQITHVSHLLRAANTEVESNVLKSPIKVESSNEQI